MPLILHENIDNVEIGLWKVSEEIETLLVLANLTAPDTITYSGITAIHRKKEWLATRALLNEIIPEQHLIKYHIDGRPYLENSHANISISHSTGYIAIILNSDAIPGIDIELVSRKVGKVGSRFLSPDELAVCNEEAALSNHRMLLHWCGKEAIYKMVPFSNIEFATDIRILLSKSAKNSGSFQGIFNHKSGPIPIPLYYKIVGEVLMVWGMVDGNKFHN
ncbi:MAG TPA: 4'-phosphopantetheinyl transferase superfamily protein [Prolixibacteraceae bacterium]|nr:4'-phosphopantetheinyl transferase superfamily protein [Prolixibacteraceae bacterium]